MKLKTYLEGNSMYLNQDFAILGWWEGNGTLLEIIKRAGLKQCISISMGYLETESAHLGKVVLSCRSGNRHYR